MTWNGFAEMPAGRSSRLRSRKAWARQLLDAVHAGRFPKDALSPSALRKLLSLRDEHVNELVRKHWGEVKGATTDEMRRNIEALPPDGFEIVCFPVKVHRASAGWTRAVAILPG